MKTVTLSEIQKSESAVYVIYSKELLDRLSELGYRWADSHDILNANGEMKECLERESCVLVIRNTGDRINKAVRAGVKPERYSEDLLYTWDEAGQSSPSIPHSPGTFCNCNSPELVQNTVMGETFNYCRKCRKERK